MSTASARGDHPEAVILVVLCAVLGTVAALAVAYLSGMNIPASMATYFGVTFGTYALALAAR